jgi:small-conductance mechanosensitive channel
MKSAANLKSTAPVAPPIQDLDSWLAAMGKPSVLLEFAGLAACVGLAWLFVWAARRALGTVSDKSILFGARSVDGVLFPLTLLALAFVARALLGHWMGLALFQIAIPVLVALAVIRLGVKVLQVAFKESRLVRLLERTLSWVAWIAMVLWVSGLLPVLLEELDQIAWKVGGATLTARNVIEGVVTACVVLIVTLWISSAIESRLLKEATGAQLSLRKAASNATRGILMLVGLLIALSAVGIDLTALSVLGGAIGVGIGLGLQKVAANYVSGFVILGERQLRIGDMVKVDGFEGNITDIKARYTLLRALNGRESIVPNELLISNRVENLSLADRNVSHTTVVSVGYQSDVDLVMRLLLQAAQWQPRVLKDPEPLAALSAFGADGLEFTLAFWLADPENGLLPLRSAINLEILKLLREHNIEIPFPQRVMHTK